MGSGLVLMLGGLEQHSLKMSFWHSVAHTVSQIPALVSHCTPGHAHRCGDFSLSLLLSQSCFWISCGTALLFQPSFPQRLNLAARADNWFLSSLLLSA